VIARFLFEITLLAAPLASLRSEDNLNLVLHTDYIASNTSSVVYSMPPSARLTVHAISLRQLVLVLVLSAHAHCVSKMHQL